MQRVGQSHGTRRMRCRAQPRFVTERGKEKKKAKFKARPFCLGKISKWLKMASKNCGLCSFGAYVLANVITFLSTWILHIMNLSSGSEKERSNSKEKLLLIRCCLSYSCTSTVATIKKSFIAPLS